MTLCQGMVREPGFEQATATGCSGDGGVEEHGVLSLKYSVAFGSCFQCKRYQVYATPSQVPDLRGAMQGPADKGTILATGSFTAEAHPADPRDGARTIDACSRRKSVTWLAQLGLGFVP